jgi:oxygen-dependent protoporphyrinogen oxidase
MRDPAGGPSAAVVLAQEVGLGADIVHPAGVGAGLYVGGSLKALPGGTMLGIPGPGTDLGGIAQRAGNDVDEGKPVLAQGEDVAVGELVRERMGDEVVAKLVDPLLGGVYAGRADGLSVEATMPGLHRLLQKENTLGAAVQKGIAASMAHSGGPVFGTVAGGLSRLVEALVKRLGELGVVVKTEAVVRDLSEVDADGVVLALPGGKAARLLPALGAVKVDYASVGLVTLRLPKVSLPELSGFLVPENEGLQIKAATFFTSKWEHLRAEDSVLIRASLGRAGSPEVLQRSDEDLIRAALADLSEVLGGLPEPRLASVDRWGGGLPQYAPGHVARVAAVRAALEGSNIALAGAAYDGIGIPACVKSGRAAAQTLMQKWGS